MKWSVFALLLLVIPGSAWMLSAENTPPSQEPPASPPPPIPCNCGEKTATQVEPAKDQEKALGEDPPHVPLPCFCPQTEYAGGYLGEYHPAGEEPCSTPELVWALGEFPTAPLYCDMGINGEDCDCVAATFLQAPKTEKQEPKPAPSTQEPAPSALLRIPALTTKIGRNEGFAGLYPRREVPGHIHETCRVLVTLQNYDGNGNDALALVSQIVKRDPNHQRPAIVFWAGVELNGRPDNQPARDFQVQLTRVATDTDFRNLPCPPRNQQERDQLNKFKALHYRANSNGAGSQVVDREIVQAIVFIPPSSTEPRRPPICLRAAILMNSDVIEN